MDNVRQFQFSWVLCRKRFFWTFGMTFCMVVLIQSFTLPYRVAHHLFSPTFGATNQSHDVIVNSNQSSTFAWDEQVQLVSGINHIESSNTTLGDETATLDGVGNAIHDDRSEKGEHNDITVESDDESVFDVDEDEEIEVEDSSSKVTSTNYSGKTIVQHLNSSQILNSFIPVDSINSVEAETETMIITSPSDKHTRKISSIIPSLNLQNNITSAWSSYLKQKKRTVVPISEMKEILFQNQVTAHSLKRQRLSARDRELLAAKLGIENAPIAKDDHLYAPIFRNVSQFRRSYELMERILKVYIYREGEKPIFHQPLLKGLYASEGWFMKLMEKNKHFVTRDPKKAHLFYLPFSSRKLQFALYVPRQSNRKILLEFLNNYVEEIAAKYPYWNQTGGSDHFLAACHDWAPFETRGKMASTIRALCNADVSKDFKLGKDVTLPEAYIRSGKNPLRDIGGGPSKQRPVLASYAGGMHGPFREALSELWEDKDPIIKIHGSKFPGVEGRMAYIELLRSSKYCICPRGYEVNSARVVEAFMYECVPVIISDNFVPPFFEVLEWESFAVFIAEKDMPILKQKLESISAEKYLSLQNGVKKAQQHFLWHSSPVKYDMFHMILHSIWTSRLNQIGLV